MTQLETGMWAELHGTGLTTYGDVHGGRQPLPTNPPLVIIESIEDDFVYAYWPQPGPDAYEWDPHSLPRTCGDELSTGTSLGPRPPSAPHLRG